MVGRRGVEHASFAAAGCLVAACLGADVLAPPTLGPAELVAANGASSEPGSNATTPYMPVGTIVVPLPTPIPASPTAEPTVRPRSVPSALTEPAAAAVQCPPFENAVTGPLQTPGGAPLYSNGPRTRRVIAITIDDAFSPSAVLADLAILQALRVNATWFPIGQVAANNPDLWRTVAKAGFPIANHTWDHANLAQYSYQQIVDDITRDNEAMARIIGQPLLPVVRPMGGSWNNTVLKAAAAAGEKAVVLWDTTDADTGRDLSNVPVLIDAGRQGRNGSILLMHANLPYAQQALPSIIAHYRSCGFGFVTVGQLLGIPGPVPFPV